MIKGRNSYIVPLCCCFFPASFRVEGGRIADLRRCYSFFNGEGGGGRPFEVDLSAPTSAHIYRNIKINSNKMWFGVPPFLSQKDGSGRQAVWRMGYFFSSLAFLVKKSGKRAAGSVLTNLTLFQKREKTEGKLRRYVKDVFERMDFRGGETFFRG